MKKIVFELLSCLLLVSCAKKETLIQIPNSEKPIIFYNRQPGNIATGKADMSILTHNDATFFVGPDARGGGALQGALVSDFLESADPEKLDRNKDGILGYVLCIGSDTQLDALLRTEGVRKALGTWNGSAQERKTKSGSIKIGQTIFQTQEIDSKVMKDKNGTAWSAKTASEMMTYWLRVFGNKIDFVISNNDAMAISCLNTKGFPKGIPLFGYDANSEALSAIEQGEMTGTVSQSFDYQAAMTMLMMRSLLDGTSAEDCVANGTETADKWGNKIKAPIINDTSNRSVLVKNSIVTKANLESFRKAFKHDSGIKHIERENTEKKILMTVYNENSYFTAKQLLPAMKYYAEALNLNLTIIAGNGHNDAVILQQINDVSQYDGFLLNLVSTAEGRAYLERLR